MVVAALNHGRFILADVEILFAGVDWVVALVSFVFCFFYTPIVNLHKNFFANFKLTLAIF